MIILSGKHEEPAAQKEEYTFEGYKWRNTTNEEKPINILLGSKVRM